MVMETLKHNAEDNRQRPETAQSSTLLRLPKPILCIADVFHSGSGGTNCTAGGCCFNTPRGSVHSTASHLYMKVWVVARVLTAITSQPAEHTNTHTVTVIKVTFLRRLNVTGRTQCAYLRLCTGPAALLCSV